MAEIMIRGMELPKENDYTIAIVYGDGVVTEYHEDYWVRGADGEKQLGTAIHVPPHGRCIDADALLKGCERTGNEYVTREWAFSQSAIENAPTIIPASE